MSALSNSISGAVNYLLTIRISDFIDIIIVAYLIYKAIWFLRRTNSYNLAQGLLILLVVLWLSEVFRLTMINNLLRKAVELGLIALLILFQPELRRILEDGQELPFREGRLQHSHGYGHCPNGAGVQ